MYTVSSTSVASSGRLAAAAASSSSAAASASSTPARPREPNDEAARGVLSPGSSEMTPVASPLGRGPNTRASGYMGYTSYSTIFEETLSILGGRGPCYHPPRHPHRPSEADDTVHVSMKSLQLGVALLKLVPFSGSGEEAFRKDAGTGDWWVFKIALRFLQSLYAEFGDYIGRERTVAKLEELARIICVNTSKPILDLPDADDFLAQFSGPNLRWESLGNQFPQPDPRLQYADVWLNLGLMFLYWDTRTDASDPPLVSDPSSPYSWQVRMLEITVSCVQLARQFSVGNVFLVILSDKRTVYESLISGDAS